jgi:hypothetical protein
MRALVPRIHVLPRAQAQWQGRVPTMLGEQRIDFSGKRCSMNEQPQHAGVIRHLEEQLLRQDVRRSADQVEALLADEFTEFGSSGRIYDKRQIIEALQQEAADGSPALLQDFCARELAPEVILVTYRTVRTAAGHSGEISTLRSSIWKWDGERWRMVFHQGTPSGSRG